MLLSKEDEIRHLREWVSKLTPGSYLASIMAIDEPMIVNAIRNDFGFSGLGEELRHLLEAREEAARLHKEIHAEILAHQSTVRDLERRVEIAKDELAEVRRISIQLCKVQ